MEVVLHANKAARANSMPAVNSFAFNALLVGHPRFLVVLFVKLALQAPSMMQLANLSAHAVRWASSVPLLGPVSVQVARNSCLTAAHSSKEQLWAQIANV